MRLARTETHGPRVTAVLVALLGLLGIGSILAIDAPSAAAAPPSRDGTLVLASLAPETGASGVLIDSLRAPVQLAVNEINAAGGIGGQPVRLVTGDEGSDATTTRQTFARFVSTDHVDAVIGPVTSRAAAALQGPIGRDRILTCSGSDTSAPLAISASKGYYFRTAPPSRLQGRALAKLVLADKHRRVMVLLRDDDYGRAIAEPMQRDLELGGARIVARAAYDPTRPDLRAALRSATATRPDAIVIIGFSADGAHIVQTLIGAGLGPRTIATYATDGLESSAFGTAVNPGDPSAVAGMQGIAPATTPAAVTSPFPAALATAGVVPVTFSRSIYDCTILTALAAVTAKSDDPAALQRVFTNSLEGKKDCRTFAECLTLLRAGSTIHWRGASSNFDRFGAYEPNEGVYDVWSYGPAGDVAIAGATAQVSVP
jgi:branched-chain amino acid transport system substrate-binding protein